MLRISVVDEGGELVGAIVRKALQERTNLRDAMFLTAFCCCRHTDRHKRGRDPGRKQQASAKLAEWPACNLPALHGRPESAVNSSRPKAVPAMPQPPSAASERITQVRAACVGSPAILATISVASATKLRWPALFNAPGGVSTWIRTVRAESVPAVWTAFGFKRWI